MLIMKYSSGNLFLLFIAIVVAFCGGWVSMMTMAFGADPVHDLKSGVVMVVLWIALVLIPASAVTARWPKLGAIICWSVVALCFASIWASGAVLLVLIPAAIEGLIATTIASRSEEHLPPSIIPK
jgi:Na+/melibiose symporter-like transporter